MFKVWPLARKGPCQRGSQSDIDFVCLPCFQVAVLDVDICGPSMPKILGVEGEQVYALINKESPKKFSVRISVNTCDLCLIVHIV